MLNKKISIIASFRNEEKNLALFAKRIHESFAKYKDLDYEIIFINDDSTDKSKEIILSLRKDNIKFKLANIKPWAGPTPSTLLGIDLTDKGNYLTVIDCDLQDPPELIAENLNAIETHDIVHFIRKKRDDSFFQRIYTYFAYLILGLISFGKIERNSAYFKIVSPELVEKLKKNTLRYPYMNYYFSRYAKNPKRVFYLRKRRLFGNSKFNIFSLNPWITFYGGVYFFTLNYLIFSTLILISSFSIFKYLQNYSDQNILKYFFILFFIIQILNILITLINYLFNLVFKKKKVYYELV